MMRGEIDFLYEVSADTVEFIEAERSVQVFPFLRNYVFAVVFNSRRSIFQEREVRQALNHAVNRNALIERTFRGKGMTANGPTWPLHWAYDSSLPQYSYDPSKASALLDSVNVPRMSQTYPTKVPARFHFTCLLPEKFDLWERMALIVQRDLSDIGVDMQIEQVSFPTFNKRIGEGDFDALVMEMIAGNSISRPYFFWHSASSINTWGYKNPLADQALNRIRRAADESEYRNAFRQFQFYHVDDPPAIFLALGTVTRAVSRRFEVVAPPGSDILPTIGDWRLANGIRDIRN
jgi:peptide/nickel transport system substrate-binding protein